MAGLLCSENCGRPRCKGKRCWPCYRATWTPERAAREKETDRVYDATKRDATRKRASHERWRKSTEGEEYLKEYRRRPTVRKKSRIAARFKHSGWTAEAFERAWREQDGDCALCGCAMCPTGTLPTSVAADHTERDGVKIPRALLCMICNRALGFYEQHQRITGLRLEPYEEYLSQPVTDRLRTESNPPS